jgi:hypothetical protein
MKAPFKTPVKVVSVGDDHAVRDARDFNLMWTNYKEHAAFIAAAINSHEALVEALEKYQQAAEKFLTKVNTGSARSVETYDDLTRCFQMGEAVLDKAKHG